MLFWEAVVLIVLISAVAGTLNTYFRHRARPDRPAPDVETSRAQDEVRQLKERIQVLERVITDNNGSRRLDDEIERLRDR
jgi:hypothetical protein